MGTLKVAARRSHALALPEGWGVAVILALHAALAVGMRTVPILVDIHSIATTLVGLGLALFSRSTRAPLYAGAYICGAEVLWRMNGGAVFYELAKYALIVIFGIALVRSRSTRLLGFPVAIVALMSISSVSTLTYLGFTDEARQQIAFNLSGPVSLAVSLAYALQVRFQAEDMRPLAWSYVFGVSGVAVLAAVSTLTNRSIHFVQESNFVTSGGFGPNQVSAVLGLGAVLLIVLAVQSGKLRLVSVLLAVILLTQSALTFSRGGVYNAAACILVLLLHSLRRARLALALSAILLISAALAGNLILPALETFTGGALSQRFADLDMTNRDVIAQEEIAIWQAHPLFGAGPGMAMVERSILFNYRTASHTEYTRILAEHGILGAIAFLLVVGLVGRAYLRAPAGIERIWVAVLATWGFAEMAHAAMRIAAISFVIGISVVQWKWKEIQK